MGGLLEHSRRDAFSVGALMNNHHLTAMIVVMGTATVLLSVFVAVRFWVHHRHLKGDSKRLSMALFGMLIGEATIGLVTLKFALLAWSGNLPSIPIEIQSALRFVAFAATSITTVHLAMVVEDLNSK